MENKKVVLVVVSVVLAMVSVKAGPLIRVAVKENGDIPKNLEAKVDSVQENQETEYAENYLRFPEDLSASEFDYPYVRFPEGLSVSGFDYSYELPQDLSQDSEEFKKRENGEDEVCEADSNENEIPDNDDEDEEQSKSVYGVEEEDSLGEDEASTEFILESMFKSILKHLQNALSFIEQLVKG